MILSHVPSSVSSFCKMKELAQWFKGLSQLLVVFYKCDLRHILKKFTGTHHNGCICQKKKKKLAKWRPWECESVCMSVQRGLWFRQGQMGQREKGQPEGCRMWPIVSATPLVTSGNLSDCHWPQMLHLWMSLIIFILFTYCARLPEWILSS